MNVRSGLRQYRPEVALRRVGDLVDRDRPGYRAGLGSPPQIKIRVRRHANPLLQPYAHVRGVCAQPEAQPVGHGGVAAYRERAPARLGREIPNRSAGTVKDDDSIRFGNSVGKLQIAQRCVVKLEASVQQRFRRGASHRGRQHNAPGGIHVGDEALQKSDIGVRVER